MVAKVVYAFVLAIGAAAAALPPAAAQTRAGSDSPAFGDFLVRVQRAGERHKAVLTLAVERAHHPAVKRFAETLVRDLETSMKRLSELADARGQAAADRLAKASAVPDVKPADLPFKRRQYQRLRALNGPAFDKQFLNGLVISYDNAVRRFEAEAARGDAATRSFVTEALPLVRTRLDDARKLLAEIDPQRN